MKLRTSYFNGTVLKKDITRFAPLWGLYTVFMLLYLLLLWQDSFYNTVETMAMMGVVNLVYGGLCASLLFGDLFHSRLCNALHAMPMRREGWFLTHLFAGLLFGVVPNMVGGVLAAFMLEEMGYVAFLWLGVATLEFVFFFGAGVFAVMCAGNRLGMTAIYCLINFFAVVAAWLMETFYAPVLPGVVMDTSFLANLCPTLKLSVAEFVDVSYDQFGNLQFCQVLAADWWYLLAVFAAGLVFLALALAIYRKRALETAGDFISLKPAAPVFLVIYTLCVGAILYWIAELFGTSVEYIFLFAGMAVGFFTGKMLLQRKVRVFQKRNLLFFAVLVVSFWATIFVTWLDPIGVTRYVPKAEQVSSVTISPYEDNDGSVLTSYSYDSFHWQRDGLTLTKPEDIEKIIQVHGFCMENDMDETGDYLPLTITYKMKSGTQVKRCYRFSAKSDPGAVLKHYFSSAQYVLGTENVEKLLTRIERVEFVAYNEPYNRITINARQAATGKLDEQDGVIYNVTGTLDNSEEAKGLFNAIVNDCEDGNLAQLWDYHDDNAVWGSISIEYRDDRNNYQYMDITVYGDSVNTTRCLQLLLLK